jgi:hypothetical protein
VLALGALTFDGQDAVARPKPPGAADLALPAAQAALVDCRSPVMVHERRVPMGGTLECAGCSVVVRGQGRALVLELSSGDRTTLHKVGAEPGLARVDRSGASPYGLSVRREPEFDGVVLSSAWGIQVPLGGEAAWIVDSDLDGELGTAGDGFVVPGCRTVGPWTDRLWCAEGGVRLVRGEGGRWRSEPIPSPYPDPDRTAAWNLLQWRRQQVGFHPVEHDATLEPGLLAHLKYLEQNDEQGHRENPSKPGYSKEGDSAGRSSVLHYGARTHRDAVEGQFRTLLHRHYCLFPEHERAAMALHGGIHGLRIVGSYDHPLGGRACVFPPHGAADVAARMLPEVPMPLRAAPGSGLGTPIGVNSRAWIARRSATPPRLALRHLERKSVGDVVLRSWHGTFDADEIDVRTQHEAHGLVALIPLATLASGLHEAEVQVMQRTPGLPEDDFRYRWTFLVTPRRR